MVLPSGLPSNLVRQFGSCQLSLKSTRPGVDSIVTFEK